MKNSVSVSRDQRIAASAAAVWSVIADPGMQERVDPRCSVESTSGDWRTVGSEFVLAIRGILLHYVVVAADPEVRWAAKLDRHGKYAGVQRGELRRSGDDTMLRWTVEVPAGLLTRGLVTWSCRRALPRWLDAVEREALAITP